MMTSKKRAPSAMPAARSAPGVLGYGDLGTSLVLIFPLFLAYEIGVMFTPSMNGVDFITEWLYQKVDYSRRVYLAIHGGLAIIFTGVLLYMRRRNRVRLRMAGPVLLESSIYALTLGTLIVFIMRRLLRFEGALAVGDEGLGHALIVSLGAGVHEELVFRLVLMGCGAYILRAMGLSRGLAVAIALLASSALFSAVHHVGPYGDPWTVSVFTYRALAGLLFGLIFYYRSLAHAVYTHFLYDVYVLVLQT